MFLRIGPIALFVASLPVALALGAWPLAQRSAPIPQGERQLRALVREGAPVPDKPGAKFQSFGEAWWLEPGCLAFWADYGSGSGLFSWKDGTVKTILPEGETVTSPNFRPKPGLVPQKMRLHRLWHPPGWIVGAHDRTLIHAGRKLLYLTIDTSYKNTGLFQSDNSTVYAWDGDKLFPVLGQEDSLPLPGGGALGIKSARVAAIGTDDQALLSYVTKGDTSGWALFDGTRLLPFLASGDPLPGLPDVRIRDTNPPKRFDISWLQWTTAWRSTEATVAVVDVAGAPYKRALLRLAPGGAQKLLAEGDPDPTEPTKKIKDLVRLEGASPDTFAVLVARGALSGDQAWLLYHRGTFQRILDRSLVQRPDPSWDSLGFGRAAFLGTDPPRMVLEVFVTKLETQLISQNQLLKLVASTQSRGDHYLFEGGPVRRLDTQGMPMDLRVLGGERPGIVLGTFPTTGTQPEGLLDSLSPPTSLMTFWFLDGTARNPGVAPPPEVAVVGDRRITFAHVIAWRAPDEAVVRQKDGFFLVTK
jgi:hypothetical protein